MPNCQFRELNELEIEHIRNIVSSFESFNDYSLVVLSNAVEIKKNQNISFLVLLSITYRTKSIRIPQNETSFTEYELFGLAKLKRDYGRVLIRPEAISDKISDLFMKVDIDFDFDPDFSKKYFVVSDDESKVRNSISKRFLETVRGFNDLEIEIAGSILLVRLRKPFTPENSKVITDFITAINDG